MRYILTFPDPHRHHIHIDIPLSASKEATALHLPTWRPGRYELGPYIENVVGVRATTASGKALAVTKTTAYHWEVEPSSEAFTFHYEYYANARDAGSSCFDERMVYINGINMFMYQPDQLDDFCELVLELPDDYQIACGLTQKGNTLLANDFDQLVDGPIMASNSLQHRGFDVEGVQHNIWFQGEVKPDWDRLVTDFTNFGKAQHQLFGGFPCEEYHYLFLIDNGNRYHGVEHYNSTVIALGPGYKLFGADLYPELLGVSCHELFHTWNVKAIRPADLQPYDYEGHDYSRLHYVTEGVTTYYGDLMLLKGGVWSLAEYLSNFNNSTLKRYYKTDGRKNISLEEASFDSWINGYKAGVPNHKTSFYIKGCLAAFILDIEIRKATRNEKSLDHVLREMYERFGKTGKGYTKADYKSIAEEFSGRDFTSYFEHVIAGTTPLEGGLAAAASYLGMYLAPRKFNREYHKTLGFTVKDNVVAQIFEGSPAEEVGLEVGDQIIALNGMQVEKGHLQLLFDHFADAEEWRLHLFRNRQLRKLRIAPKDSYRNDYYMLAEDPNASAEQIANRDAWMRVRM